MGLTGWFSRKISGESSEEFAARQAYVQSVEQRRNERIEKAKKQRDDERKDAERALAEARKFEDTLRAKIRKNTADLKKNRDGLAEAKANLEKTRSQFQRLANEKIELVSEMCHRKNPQSSFQGPSLTLAKTDIVEILQQSAEQLRELKRQVHDLDLFFKSILNDVDITVRKDLSREFIRPIKKSMRRNYDGNLTNFKMNDEGRNVSPPLSSPSTPKLFTTSLGTDMNL